MNVMLEYILSNYTWILFGLIIILLAIIGWYADKTNFGLGKTVEDKCVVEELAMKMALGENPKRVYGNSKTSPQTRMASAALMREWLIKAKKVTPLKTILVLSVLAFLAGAFGVM